MSSSASRSKVVSPLLALWWCLYPVVVTEPISLHFGFHQLNNPTLPLLYWYSRCIKLIKFNWMWNAAIRLQYYGFNTKSSLVSSCPFLLFHIPVLAPNLWKCSSLCVEWEPSPPEQTCCSWVRANPIWLIYESTNGSSRDPIRSLIQDAMPMTQTSRGGWGWF